MRKIPLTHSLLAFMDELEYTESALAAWADASHLGGPFREELAEFEEVVQKERSARRDVVRAEALVTAGNARMDTVTMRFGTALLTEAGRDRESALFRRFFPEAPSLFIRRSLRTQCERTLGVVVVELERLGASSPLYPFAEALSSAAEDALATLDVRTTAKASRAVLESSVDDWKEGVNRLRLSTYGELLKIAAEKRYEKEWAQSFFRTSPRAEPVEVDERASERPPAVAG